MSDLGLTWRSRDKLQKLDESPAVTITGPAMIVRIRPDIATVQCSAALWQILLCLLHRVCFYLRAQHGLQQLWETADSESIVCPIQSL